MATINRFYVDTLSDYLNLIKYAVNYYSTKYNPIPPLWFRGQEDVSYKLMPNISRKNKEVIYNTNYRDIGKYSTLRLGEEYRYQHFSARSYHLLSSMPDNMIEWQEIMEHHRVKTRLLDWSENPIVAIMFALEKFMLPYEDREIKHHRRTMAPVVWFLAPCGVNEKVYDCLSNKEIIEDVLNDLLPGMSRKKGIIAESCAERMKSGKEVYFDLKMSITDNNVVNHSTSGIVSLAGLSMLRQEAGARLVHLLESGEFNPFYYMLLRIYSDGAIVSSELPPLAVIHPYHSERIRAQKGVFTVFPHVLPHSGESRPMEQSLYCADFIWEVRITNPNGIAKELLQQGYRQGDLYPELDKYAQDIERERYYYND